ncbi:MAG TPA: arginase family protein [Allosphingosinicella sp.]|jgi:arginase family enzyme|uniref:arginase family protein n=1 Tax=Allosphingosinicella sp. TaxID=2823234 RepID=UPI002F28CE56
MSNWPRITDLFVTEGAADVALLGAPMNRGAVTSGHYDQAPSVIRQTLGRFSTYDVETGQELSLRIRDFGDVDVAALSLEDGFEPVRDAVQAATGEHDLTILLGGHNGATRPAAHGLGVPLDQVGLITLDAHFDLRETDAGLLNGNPIRALLEDGLPGRNICQIGLAPYANTAAMHRTAKEEGIGVFTISEVKRRGLSDIFSDVFARLSHLEAIMIDFDIDVIDRAQCPGAPGARPGGTPVDMFFEAARMLASNSKVRLVDLTEFDPSLDVADITALTAGRWACEVLAGFATRSSMMKSDAHP